MSKFTFSSRFFQNSARFIKVNISLYSQFIYKIVTGEISRYAVDVESLWTPRTFETISKKIIFMTLKTDRLFDDKKNGMNDTSLFPVVFTTAYVLVYIYF